MDQMGTQIRMFRPLSVDRTEVTIYCFAPVGEAPELRAKRIRQYEDFFNASGMATPDDLTEFNESQVAAASTAWCAGATCRAAKRTRSPARTTSRRNSASNRVAAATRRPMKASSSPSMHVGPLMAPVDQEGGQ